MDSPATTLHVQYDEKNGNFYCPVCRVPLLDISAMNVHAQDAKHQSSLNALDPNH